METVSGKYTASMQLLPVLYVLNSQQEPRSDSLDNQLWSKSQVTRPGYTHTPTLITPLPLLIDIQISKELFAGQ